MAKIIICTNNVHRDEVDELKQSLENGCWANDELTTDEIKGLTSIINYVINIRIVNNASDLSYLELLNLKNKIQR